MNANNLMLGNLVCFTNVIGNLSLPDYEDKVIIKEIGEYKCIVFEPKNERTSYCANDNLSGIEITDDLLLQLGFKEVERNCFSYAGTTFSIIKFTIETITEYYAAIIKTSYLHELQNTFALHTKQQLDITPLIQK